MRYTSHKARLLHAGCSNYNLICGAAVLIDEGWLPVQSLPIYFCDQSSDRQFRKRDATFRSRHAMSNSSEGTNLRRV